MTKAGCSLGRFVCLYASIGEGHNGQHGRSVLSNFGNGSPEMVFRRARSRRTFEDATEQIVEAIKAGDLQVGDRLPSERVLSAQMQISRPTLRQAIRLLADAGIIEVKPGPGGGMIVRSDSIPAELI